MIWQRVRMAVVACIVAAAASLPYARAADPCAPAMKTIQVEECVPEYYKTKRTVHKMQQVEEKYTAYKCELVPEKRKVTVWEKVPVEETRTRCVTVSVPCVEERTCMEKHWVCKEVTTYKKECVDKGHWECREVPCGPSMKDRLFGKKKDCCDPCADACPKTKTVKCWVPCKEWVCKPCTKTVKVCEYRPVTKKVTVCKKEVRHETYKCTVCKCVAREKECIVHVEKKTEYQATRKVCKCVPVEEEVTCCKMVKRIVEKQVPACNPCCDPCSKKKSKCCN